MTTPGQASPAEQLGCDQKQLQLPPQVQNCRFIHHPQWQSSAQEVLRLLPRLNQEYKREVQLLLRACQVASSVAKYSTPPENNLELATLEGEEAAAAEKALQEALQHLRSSYQQELVAATSALFAICKGFGQSSHVMVASSEPIKSALVAAQQQHLRVEQLWQDLMLAAAGSASS
eukprot:gene13283-13414_t